MVTKKPREELLNFYADNKQNNDSYNIYFSLSSYNGYLDPLLLKSINAHWFQFHPPYPWEHYTIAIIILIIAIIGLFGNFVVIYMYFRCRNLRTVSNILPINLAVSDFCMLAKSPIFIYNCLKFGPASGDLACRLYGFVGGLTGTISITTLAAISVERYYVIRHPLTSSYTKKRSILMVVTTWLYSFFFAIMPALNMGWSKYTPEGFLTSCSFDYLDKRPSARLFMFIFFISAWMIPLTIIIYCYVQILQTVKLTMNVQSNRQRHCIEKKIAIVILNVIALWFLAWTPYAIVALLGISDNHAYLTPWISMLPATFCKASACINPYLYSMTHPKFKKEILRMFGRVIQRPMTTTQTTMRVRYTLRSTNI